MGLCNLIRPQPWACVDAHACTVMQLHVYVHEMYLPLILDFRHGKYSLTCQLHYSLLDFVPSWKFLKQDLKSYTCTYHSTQSCLVYQWVNVNSLIPDWFQLYHSILLSTLHNRLIGISSFLIPRVYTLAYAHCICVQEDSWMAQLLL